MIKKLKPQDQASHQEWLDFMDRVQQGKPVKKETQAQQQARIKKARKDYNYFVQTYFSHYTEDERGENIDCGPFQVELAKKTLGEERIKAIIAWARDHAKSVHVDIFLPIWLKIQEQRSINTMVLIGANETAAKRLLMGIQAELMFNERVIHDFGTQHQHGDWQKLSFSTRDGFTCFGLGMGQPVRGIRKGAKRPDYVVLDDLEDRKTVLNQERISEQVNWILRDVIPMMSVNAARLFVVNNYCVKNGILDTLRKLRPDAFWWNQVDALNGRGTPSWKAKFNKGYFNEVRDVIGIKAFLSEYMNDPQEDGGQFTSEMIVWESHLWEEMDAIVAYCDPSFSTTEGSDFTALKWWGIKDGKRIKLKAYLRQRETIERVLMYWNDFHFKLPPRVRDKVQNWIEGNATQKIIIREKIEKLRQIKGFAMPYRFDLTKKADKEDRILSMVGDYEAGLVVYEASQQKNKDMLGSIEQLTAWRPGGSFHDDAPDADQGAWSKLPRKKKGGSSLTIGRFRINYSR